MPILPPQTIGILGGGQLGRMTAIAARRMGYRVHVLDPTPDSPAGQVADRECTAAYDDLPAARDFAAGVDVITFEFENVPSDTLAALAEVRPVHPSPLVLDTCRHRVREKHFLSSHGFPCAPHRALADAGQLADAAGELGLPCILKSADLGYDGKGQVRIDSPDRLATAWQEMGRPTGVLEGVVHFVKEISVIVARTQVGQCVAFPCFENEHRNHILDITTAPADIEASIAREATAIAIAIAEQFWLVGLIAVEMFLCADGKLLVNELAPRPHNSGHLTGDAAITSQFEQHVRAICGLPLGDPSLLRPAAMANLLGDMWTPQTPDWAAALTDPTVKLHLYGKSSPQRGRKMGHLTALAPTATAARAAVREARNRLSR
jgi:5-(carboxyamino)imidazole ribonucleotide synthase